MSFTMIPVGTANYGGISTPYRMSFCVTDSGSGGDLYLNCQGVDSGVQSGAVDLPDFFGTSFNSQDVAFIMKRATADTDAANALIISDLDILIAPVTSTASAAVPAWIPLVIGPAPNVPLIHVIGPAVAGNWRMNIARRHSLLY